ncbi:MAG: hypothetical protein V2I38_07985 [Alcanivoracaceae bacterium]|jgi:hypothetical protein|nr:hypothetical protein [Alcanivoracaceae bacterium]
MKCRSLIALLAASACVATARADDIRLESGAVWLSRNDVRIPNDTGTRFDLLELTGKGADPYARLYASHDFNERHSLRLTLAPLRVSGTGTLSKNTTFRGQLFNAGVATQGTYQFSTYRLTYRWLFHDEARWRLGVGGVLLVRDAEITLRQGATRVSDKDVGLVPLLHGYAAYQFNERLSAQLDVEGAWSPMGRAVDAALTAQYDFDSGLYLAAGYRTLEGGADNDDVYTFAWLHYFLTTVGYRF